jgi:hypothetical protein
MVAVFLQTEVASTRFAPTILAILRRDGRERRIIDHPDLSNAADNAYRRHVLGEYRGYGQDADVFKDFPADVRWYRASATKEDLARVRYINDDYWTALSGGSRLVRAEERAGSADTRRPPPGRLAGRGVAPLPQDRPTWAEVKRPAGREPTPGAV